MEFNGKIVDKSGEHSNTSSVNIHPTNRSETSESSEISQNSFLSSREASSFKEEPSVYFPKIESQILSRRAYLDRTVVPILVQGMAQLARDRPSHPIEYLATYLQKHREKYGE